METAIKYPLILDKTNECISDSAGYVLLRYTWGITPLDWQRKQEAKAHELVTIANFHYAATRQDPDELPHSVNNGTGPALPEEILAEVKPKKRGNPAWVKGWNKKK